MMENDIVMANLPNIASDIETQFRSVHKSLQNLKVYMYMYFGNTMYERADAQHLHIATVIVHVFCGIHVDRTMPKIFLEYVITHTNVKFVTFCE